jgi:hypothetical protein
MKRKEVEKNHASRRDISDAKRLSLRFFLKNVEKAFISNFFTLIHTLSITENIGKTGSIEITGSREKKIKFRKNKTSTKTKKYINR